jgi:hypothetical protein
MRRGIPISAAGLFFLTLTGCHDDDDTEVVTMVVTGTSASDYLFLDDYLADTTVGTLIGLMPQHAGSTPPNLDGSYSATGNLTATSIPGTAVGDAFSTQFCLGPPAGSALEVAFLDAGVVSAGANSFIEGSGDLFTVYTAFKTITTGPNGFTSEQHQVAVLSGRRDLTGDLVDLSIGIGIVGLVGDCGNLAVGDVQVAGCTALLTDASCVGSQTPSSEDNVLVTVENFLLVDANVFADGVFVDVAPLLSSLTFEATPGFTLSFETIQPLNESDAAMGVILSWTFDQDTQAAGRFSQYLLTNIVGDDYFFSPVVQNLTGGDVTVHVNEGTPVAATAGTFPTSNAAQYFLGYYHYDVIGVITALEANVRIDRPAPFSDLLDQGPFTLGADSGALALLATTTPP